MREEGCRGHPREGRANEHAVTGQLGAGPDAALSPQEEEGGPLFLAPLGGALPAELGQVGIWAGF